MATKRSKPSVHFIFADHSPGKKYMHRSERDSTKAWVFESASGVKHDLVVSGHNIDEIVDGPSNRKKPHAGSTFYESQKEFLRKLLRKKKKVVVGEREQAEMVGMLDDLSQRAYDAWRNCKTYPTLSNIKNYYRQVSLFTDARHRLVADTIEELIKEGHVPIEAQYGSGHSGFQEELRLRGIRSTHELKPKVFSWAVRIRRHITRQLMLERYPSKRKAFRNPNATEYKKAYIAELIEDDLVEPVLGKPEHNISDAEISYYNKVSNHLVDHLTLPQIDEIIRTQNNALIFQYNKLPNPLNKDQSHNDVLGFRRAVEKRVKK